MPPVVNIAAYKFAPLTGLAPLREELRGWCKSRHLGGTILLSPEGINLFVAGARENVDALLGRLRQIAGFEDLQAKESFSFDKPFSRMLVKIKKEIIAFGVEGIEPARYTSRRISAQQLKKWLDEGKPVTLLDTRNDFEVQAGTFKNAVAVGVDDFRDLPVAVDRLPQELRDQPIVTFCTGGIRCEKAAPFLERHGFADVYQLDGGILKYFEECGGAHYNGACFVFDKRVALDPSLQATDLKQCYVCQAILTKDDQASPLYVEAVSCPRCYKSTEAAREELLQSRRQKLLAVASPLPGSVPYDNVRPISVPLRLDGFELLDFLDAMRTHLSRQQWQEICEQGRLVCRDQPAKPGRIVRAGERFNHTIPATREPDVATAIDFIYEDEAIVVVSKPAPLPMHPCGRFNRNSLSYLLNEVYQPLKLRAAHRLDADTSGIVVLARTRDAARQLQPQFENGDVKKHYLALAWGHPPQDVLECDAAISDEPGQDGVRLPAADGAPSQTRFRVLRRLPDGTSLLEVEPLTGRTNQIRVHLWHLGLPIVGDPIYQRDGKLGIAQSLSLTDPPLCLHAATLEFNHPFSQERLTFSAPPPGWLSAVQ